MVRQIRATKNINASSETHLGDGVTGSFVHHLLHKPACFPVLFTSIRRAG